MIQHADFDKFSIMINYTTPYFRPPSEAKSFILQATIGCSHNKCTYCAMYRNESQKFRMRSLKEIKSIIDYAGSEGLIGNRVFIADGNALVISTKKLLDIIGYLKRRSPGIERITMYANVGDILKKSSDDLRILKENGLEMVYIGFESGDDIVLERIKKGANFDQTIKAARKLKQAGIMNSAMVLLGIGGMQRSEEHAYATGRLLTEADPEYVGALSLQIRRGAPIYDIWSAGDFVLPGKFAMIRELEIIVEETNLTNGYFYSNHISNYLPLKAKFPEEKDKMLNSIREVLGSKNERSLRPDFYRDVINQY